MSRSPERIPAVLGILAETWSLHPDWRLGQLIYNATWKAAKGDLPSCPPLFMVEDEKLAVGLIMLMLEESRSD